MQPPRTHAAAAYYLVDNYTEEPMEINFGEFDGRLSPSSSSLSGFNSVAAAAAPVEDLLSE